MSEDDPQYMMNKAKKEVIMDTLKANNNECSCACTFRVHYPSQWLEAAPLTPLLDAPVHAAQCLILLPPSLLPADEKLFQVAEEAHCDVLAAALLSLKRAKVVKFDGMMLLMPTHKDVVVTLTNPDYDPFAT